MLRRCLATPHPCFGMIPPPRPATPGSASTAAAPGNDYGTMLQIRNVQMLPDGRSIVETWGSWRFRIMERGVLDGYTVARIERVDDFEEELDVCVDGESEEGEGQLEGAVARAAGGGEGAGAGPSSGVAGEVGARRRTPTNEQLMAVCREFLEELKEGTPWVGQHLNVNYVPMPEDAARFSFWMALVRLPRRVSFYNPLQYTDFIAASPDPRARKVQTAPHPLAAAAAAARRALDRAAAQQLVSPPSCSPPRPLPPSVCPRRLPSTRLMPRPKVPRLRLCLLHAGGSLVAVRSADARAAPAPAARRAPRHDGLPPPRRPRPRPRCDDDAPRGAGGRARGRVGAGADVGGGWGCGVVWEGVGGGRFCWDWDC